MRTPCYPLPYNIVVSHRAGQVPRTGHNAQADISTTTALVPLHTRTGRLPAPSMRFTLPAAHAVPSTPACVPPAPTHHRATFEPGAAGGTTAFFSSYSHPAPPHASHTPHPFHAPALRAATYPLLVFCQPVWHSTDVLGSSPVLPSVLRLDCCNGSWNKARRRTGERGRRHARNPRGAANRLPSYRWYALAPRRATFTHYTCAATPPTPPLHLPGYGAAHNTAHGLSKVCVLRQTLRQARAVRRACCRL